MAYIIPVWGRLQKSQDLSIICTIISAHLQSGGKMAGALDSAQKALANDYAREQVEQLAWDVEDGHSLESAFTRKSFFPRMLGWGLGTAEARDDVPGTFGTFARIYSSGLEKSFEVLFQVMTPVGLLVLALWFSFAAVALFLPMIALLEGIN